MFVFFSGGGFAQFAAVERLGKLRKGKHRVVFAVFAKKRSVVAQIHILQMISDKTAEAALHALAEIL